MSVEVGFALALWGLLLIPFVLLLARKSQFLLSPGRRTFVVAFRVLTVALVVLAIADVRVGLPTDDLAVTTVIDSSASVSDAERHAVGAQLDALAQTEPDVRQARVYDREGDPNTSSLARDVRTAATTLPRDHVRRMVIATDGRDADDDVLVAVRDALNTGVRVDVLPIGDAPPIDALALSSVEAPRLVRAGETLEIEVGLSVGRSTTAALTARIDGEEAATSEAQLAPGDGRASISVPFPEEEGIHRLEIEASAPGDIVRENDRITTLVRVLSRPRVLHLHDEDSAPPLVSVLEDAEMEVESRAVGDAPTSLAELDRYGLVVIDEVDPEGLSEAQQIAVRRFVEELGGGLVTITGGHPVKRSPETFREIEPIRPAPAIPEPRPLELVLVVDRSGSMQGQKLAMARTASIAAVDALREDALAGVVAFSGGADRVMAPVPVAEDAEREALRGFISRINAGGGTNIAAALGAAGAIMSNDPRYIHHVILLSDGESDAGPAIAQAQGLAARGISISAITLGPRSALMAEIARVGRGRYHVTNNPGSLPALFVREAQFRQPPAHRTGRITPRVVMPHRSLEGIDFSAYAPLSGHALAAEKPEASILLESERGEPLLVHWHRGVGQVASFTSSTTGGWADGWRGTDIFHTFWSQLAWSLMRSRTVEPLELRTDPIPGVADRVRIVAVAPTIHALPSPEVRLHRTGGDVAVDAEGERLAMELVGPGLFAREVPIEGGFLVTAQMPADPEPTAALAVDRSYPEEIARFGRDESALARLAEVGGGSVLSAPAEAFADVTSQAVSTPLGIWLFLAALFFYLLSVLLLRLPDDAAAKAAAAKIVRPSRWSEPPDEPRKRRWTPRRNKKRKAA